MNTEDIDLRIDGLKQRMNDLRKAEREYSKQPAPDDQTLSGPHRTSHALRTRSRRTMATHLTNLNRSNACIQQRPPALGARCLRRSCAARDAARDRRLGLKAGAHVRLSCNSVRVSITSLRRVRTAAAWSAVQCSAPRPHTWGAVRPAFTRTLGGVLGAPRHALPLPPLRSVP